MLCKVYLSLCFCFFLITHAHAAKLVDHVVIISIDGGKPQVMLESKMSTIESFVKDGAHTWDAQTISPPITLPSHVSMLTGVDIAKHKVDWNEYEPKREKLKYPTIFALAKKHNPKLKTATFVGKIKLRHLWLPDSLDEFNYGRAHTSLPFDTKKITSIDSNHVASQASSYILKHKPNLSFIHFPDADLTGHTFGWGSSQQKNAFREIDHGIRKITQAIKEAGIQDKTVIIVTADHGGMGKSHKENIPDNLNIPWIAHGAKVKKNYKIIHPIKTFDTAATALWLLGIPLPENFDGKAVTAVF